MSRQYVRHYHPAHLTDEVRRVCLNCPYGKCTDEGKGCAAYRRAVKEVSDRTNRHKWPSREARQAGRIGK